MVMRDRAMTGQSAPHPKPAPEMQVRKQLASHSVAGADAKTLGK